MSKPTNVAQEEKAPVEEWVNDYSDYLYRYAYRYFNDDDVAQDLVQETLLAAVRGAESFQGNSSVRTWLTSILRHKIIDRIRSKDKRETLSDDPEQLDRYFEQNGHWREATAPSRWEINPEDNLQQQQFLRVLEGCLAGVSERDRRIFLMRELEGMSRTEICNELGLTSTHVGVLLHRVRLALRGCIEMNWLKEASS